MKKLLVISLVITVLMSCEKDDISRIKLDKDYFPLEIGNQWNFELAGKDSIIAINKINGIDYYEFVNDYGTTSYYRKQDDRIYVKSLSKENRDEMKFDLGANIDETWKYGAGYVTLVNRSATITIGDTQIDSCLQFNFHNKDLIDYGSTIWLAPRIGFIQQTCQECFGSSFETMKLETAKINGQLIEFK
ncbi:hypothetical protein [Marinifilum sp. D714]|uniref:hypothetical protein n=1 Tax=Marinifilum sp. D714 TaxID=2937523 RepID=UPI0027CE6A8A|nr:hypothetical protein [Marinifilum sp. D714]MDQ2179190.1 hypothetical protein [Marinifilum sp. D714]